MNQISTALAGKRIGIFGNGGSDKTTVAALLAERLPAHGYAVCLLDADSANMSARHATKAETP